MKTRYAIAILFFLAGAPAQSSPRKCSIKFSNQKEIRAAIASIKRLGFSTEIARRLVENNEVLLPNLIAHDARIKLPNQSRLSESGRGWKRELDLKRLSRKETVRAITVYRGLQVESLDQIAWRSKYVRSSQQSITGNVVFVSKEYGEAETYAAHSEGDFGYVLKLRIPETLLYMLNSSEGLIHPSHFNNLGSYLEGIYEVKDSNPYANLSHFFGPDDGLESSYSSSTLKLKKTWIPFSRLPNEIKQKIAEE